MPKRNNSKVLLIIIGVLTLTVMALGVLTYRFYATINEEATNNLREKMMIRQELRDLKRQYAQEIQFTAGLKEELKDAQSRIDSLLDELNRPKTNVQMLASYRKEIQQLRFQNRSIMRKSDSIVKVNQQLVAQSTQAQNTIRASRESRDSLYRANELLKKDLEAARLPKILIQKSEGVILRRSGKRISSDRADRIDRAEICLDVQGAIPAALRREVILIQVTDPNNNVIGFRGTYQAQDVKTLYSAQLEVSVIDQGLSPCVLVAPFGEHFLSGSYKVLVILKGEVVAESSFALN